MSDNSVKHLLSAAITVLVFCTTSSVCFADDTAASGVDQGMLPVPDYSGKIGSRTTLTGDWAGLRQDWANRGITLGFDWYQSYQDIIDGGFDENDAYSTNLDYRLNLDLMRMGIVPGALVTVRAQSRLGDTVNGASGLLLPVNMYSAFPYGRDEEADVDFAITELNWLQFLSDRLALLAGKITTLGTSNEFMGGEGRTQFMNFQLNFSSTLAQLAPYSTLAASAIWLPNSTWTISTTLMNYTDASTTSGFCDIGDGATWATTADYRANCAKVAGLNFEPENGPVTDTTSDSWAVDWSGWQYLYVEGESRAVDPTNGRQDLQGVGLFARVGIADKDTNPIYWTFSAGLSGRGSIPGRDADTWGIGYFYNDVQDLKREYISLNNTNGGVEVYYDIALFGWAHLTLDAQWVKSAFESVENATILGGRLTVGF